jgi:hypothetical protein
LIICVPTAQLTIASKQVLVRVEKPINRIIVPLYETLFSQREVITKVARGPPVGVLAHNASALRRALMVG